MHAANHGSHPAIATLLLRWQTTGDELRLETLVDAVRPIVERVARTTLRRHHIHDPAAVDDVVAIVFDHIRRLPGHPSVERKVAPFMPAMIGGAGDPGLAYIVWLATERARDVARSCRSRARRAVPFSQLDAGTLGKVQQIMSSPPRAGPGQQPSDAFNAGERDGLLHVAMQRLEPRLIAVLRMLLDGKSQTAIAATLNVCEGTVSRMRVRAIERLREIMRES